MTKARKKPTITLELTKELFTGDSVKMFIQDKVIALNGTIPDYILNQTIGGRLRNSSFILQNVSNEQIANLKEQLDEIVSIKSIKDSGRILPTSIKSKIDFQRLKAVIVYRNTIYQINNLSILKKEDGSNSVIFRIVQ